MVKLSKLLAYIFFFILALIYFMPKESVYYYLEKELQKQKVILSDEEIIDSGFSLQLNNTKLSYDSIESANVENINIKIFLVYNSLSVSNVKLLDVASSFVPLQIDAINIKYTILNPLNIVAESNGEFGQANAKVNILDRNISIVLKPSQLMLKKYRATLRNLKKNKAGEYKYEKTF